VDWSLLDHEFAWIKAMRDCPQDAVFHAEGDVWTHVHMVCDAMAALAEWRALPEFEREILFAAALLHDVAKPVCTRIESGRITSRGHSVRGSIMSRRLLWELGSKFEAREQVCALVLYHQAPFHLVNRSDSQRMAFLISLTARCDLLTILAKADASGRVCADRAELLTNIELFREYCQELDCLVGPRSFPSTHSRFQYFRSEGRDPLYLAHENPRCEVMVMSGLPGSGKDSWIERHVSHLPVISLDAIRARTGTEASDNQGAIVQAAREQARIFLREGRDFVWNATNLSRERRGQLIDLLAAYEARVRIAYVEASVDRLYRQNRQRENVVPTSAIDSMLERWEVPAPHEADAVEWWIDGELIPSR
jgi:predicted kinase